MSRALLHAWSWTDDSSGFQHEGGTTRWMAKEFFTDGFPIQMTIDIWAFGMVAYVSVVLPTVCWLTIFKELLSGNIPYYDMAMGGQVVMAIYRGKLPEKPENLQPFEVFDQLWEICQSCWKEDPALRPTADQLMHTLEEMREPNQGEPELLFFATFGSLQEVALAGPETD